MTLAVFGVFVNCAACPLFEHALPHAGRIEKYIVRKAFDTPEDPYLPSEVLWRQKEQFSDGVGYNWIDGLKVSADGLMQAGIPVCRDMRLSEMVLWAHGFIDGCHVFPLGMIVV